MMPTRFITYSLFVFALVSAGLVAKPPNIIVVFTDDHGWADLGVHGVVDDIKTPHLDTMAREGVIFSSGQLWMKGWVASASNCDAMDGLMIP